MCSVTGEICRFNIFNYLLGSHDGTMSHDIESGILMTSKTAFSQEFFKIAALPCLRYKTTQYPKKNISSPGSIHRPTSPKNKMKAFVSTEIITSQIKDVDYT